jgi:hypothetical protein
MSTPSADALLRVVVGPMACEVATLTAGPFFVVFVSLPNVA